MNLILIFKEDRKSFQIIWIMSFGIISELMSDIYNYNHVNIKNIIL